MVQVVGNAPVSEIRTSTIGPVGGRWGFGVLFTVDALCRKITPHVDVTYDFNEADGTFGCEDWDWPNAPSFGEVILRVNRKVGPCREGKKKVKIFGALEIPRLFVEGVCAENGRTQDIPFPAESESFSFEVTCSC